MDPALRNSIVIAALSGVVSGLAVALLTYFLGRKKTAAEIANLKAQTEKAVVETSKIEADLKNVAATVSYTMASPAQQILFQSSKDLDGFDVKGSPGQFWSNNSQPTSPLGEGQLSYEDGALNIQRTNTAGRYELLFLRYLYKGVEHPSIPGDHMISGKRRLLASCEAKCIGAEHTLRFIIRDPATGHRLARDTIKVASSTWTPYQVFLAADPSIDSQFRIDDEQVSHAPSSIQIRNIVLAQRN